MSKLQCWQCGRPAPDWFYEPGAMFVGRDEEIAPGDRWWQGDVTEDGETGLLCPNCVAIRQEHAEEES